MISFEMQSIGQNTLAMTLETAPLKKLGPELESVSKMLVETHPRRDYFLAGLEYEYYGLMKVFSDYQSHASNSPPLLRLPGQIKRETRLFKNDYLAGLEELRGGRSAGRLRDFDLGNWFIGRRGYLSSKWISNFDLANRQYMLTQKRQAFLHLWLELLRKGQANGRFPADFSQIVTLEGLDPKQIDYTVLPGNQMRLKMKLSPDEVPQENVSTDPGLKEWRLLMGTDWEVHGRL